MQVVCESNELQSCLSKILFLVEKSDFLRIQVNEGKCWLSTSCAGISAQASFPTQGKGEGEVVIASKYAPIFLSLPPRIELEFGAGGIEVRSDKSFYVFPSQKGGAFPYYDFQIDFSIPFSSLQQVLRTALRAIPRTVVEANRRVLDCVLLESKGEKISVVVTDGARMFVGEVWASTPPFSILLSREHATLLTKIEGVNIAGVKFTPETLFLSFPTNLFCAISQVNLPFPNYRVVVEQVRQFPSRAKINVSDFEVAVQRLELIGEIVTVSLTPESMELGIDGSGRGKERIEILSNGNITFSIPVRILSTVLPVCPDAFVELHFDQPTRPIALSTTQFTYYFATIPP